jgi:hypothetical protein
MDALGKYPLTMDGLATQRKPLFNGLLFDQPRTTFSFLDGPIVRVPPMLPLGLVTSGNGSTFLWISYAFETVREQWNIGDGLSDVGWDDKMGPPAFDFGP